MKNWKTSAAGTVSAASAFIVAYGADLHLSPWVMAVGKFVFAGGLAFLGLVSKDFTSHSTVAEVHEATAKEEKPQV